MFLGQASVNAWSSIGLDQKKNGAQNCHCTKALDSRTEIDTIFQRKIGRLKEWEIK
jgi:hypothetical protein